MEASYFFVQLLAQNIDPNLVGIAVLPKIELRQDLIGKRIRHHEARVTSGAAEIDQTTFGEQEDFMAIGKTILIYLRFDVGALDSFGRVQGVDLNLVIKVAYVRDDGLIFHAFDVLELDHIDVTGSGNIDIAPAKGVFDGSHFVTFHRGLQRIDRIDLSDDNARALAAQRLGTAFSDVAVAANDRHFAGNHDIERAV